MKPIGVKSRVAAKGLALCITLAVALFLVVPVVFSAMAGVSQNVMQGPLAGVTMRWILEVVDLYHEAVLRSLAIALACVVVTALIGTPLAYGFATRRVPFARALEELLMLPVAVPGLATGLALILAYGTLRDFRSSSLFILTGHVLFTLPFMMRAVLAVMLAADLPTLEEAAASLGALPRQRFMTVVLPNARRGVIAGALMVFCLSIGEFNITWMLHTPTTQTLPVGLADAYSSMRLEVGSAYTIVFLLLILPILVGMQWFGKSIGSSAKLI
jgi:putative spermidine/putrescine transport system permease protein